MPGPHRLPKVWGCCVPPGQQGALWRLVWASAWAAAGRTPPVPWEAEPWAVRRVRERELWRPGGSPGLVPQALPLVWQRWATKVLVSLVG